MRHAVLTRDPLNIDLYTSGRLDPFVNVVVMINRESNPCLSTNVDVLSVTSLPTL